MKPVEWVEEGKDNIRTNETGTGNNEDLSRTSNREPVVAETEK